jgi:hypothetical protein
MLLTRRKQNGYVVYGGDNSTYSKNMNPNQRAIHIHGVEHNLAMYAKYYSCGCIEISGSGEFTRAPIFSKKQNQTPIYYKCTLLTQINPPLA